MTKAELKKIEREGLPFEDLVTIMCMAYWTIFPTRLHALEHLFCVNGNGYEWNKNGRLSTSLVHDKLMQKAMGLFMNGSRDQIEREDRREYHQTILDSVYPLCQYAKMVTVPDNVQPDYLAGIYEMLDFIDQLDPTGGYRPGENKPNMEFAKKVRVNLDARKGL